MEAVISLQAVMLLFLSIISYFLKREVTKRDEYQNTTTKKIDEIETNYLDRFDKIADKIIESERRVVDKIIEVVKGNH